MLYQFRIYLLQTLPVFEHDIGRIFPLIQNPIISFRKYLFDARYNGIYLPGNSIKYLCKIDGNKLFCYLLRPLHIVNLNNTVIVSLITNTLRVQLFGYPFTAVDIDLYLKGKPCLKPYMHKTKFLVLVIKVNKQTFAFP